MDEKHAKQTQKKTKREKFKGRNPFVKILIVILQLLAAAVICFALLIGWLSVTEYKPADVEAVAVEGEASKTVSAGDDIKVMSWNIGYGALGDNADFFMDGGSGVITADKERVAYNLEGISNEIESADADIFFLQEVDENSKRSHHVNELGQFRDEFSGYASAFAYNYKTNYVPYPIPPLGKVQSGIATFSEYGLEQAERYQLPCPFSWPVRLANLKRALLVTRVPVKGTDKELVLVNLHLEAYDSGEGKIAQTKQLAEFLTSEYEKGNYVIAGGDFNQIFSSADQNAYPAQEGKWQPGVIDVTEIEGDWSFLQDETTPSCRSLDQAYAGADHSNFQYYLIDGFIVSGNIEVKDFGTDDLDFEFSDHNPLLMEVTLK